MSNPTDPDLARVIAYIAEQRRMADELAAASVSCRARCGAALQIVKTQVDDNVFMALLARLDLSPAQAQGFINVARDCALSGLDE